MERQDLTEAVSFLIGTGTLSELVRLSVAEAKAQQYDFRSPTCGECAWATLYNGGTQGNPQVDKYFMCRRTGWQRQDEDSLSTIAACPAFVPREEKRDD